jgi:hypothetical protein
VKNGASIGSNLTVGGTADISLNLSANTTIVGPTRSPKNEPTLYGHGNNSTASFVSDASLYTYWSSGGEDKSIFLYFDTTNENTSNNKGLILVEAVGTSSRQNIHFCLSNTSNNSPFKRATIDEAILSITCEGNVGIGSKTPEKELDVNGSARISTDLTVGSTITNGTSDFKASFGNTTSISNILTGFGNRGAILSVSDTQYDDDSVIASFSRGSGSSPSIWEIGGQSFMHKRGTSDILEFKVASNNVLFGNKTTAKYLSFNADTSITSNAAITTSSDDRLKENEKLIENATETLSKLTPQLYDKYKNMDLSGEFHVESGLIAQEVYYNAPELRHLVRLGQDYLRDASGNALEEELNRTYFTPTPDEMDLSDVDIMNDPDYSNRGWSKTDNASFNYQGLIPYLVKSNQEMAEKIAVLENK